MNVSVVRLCRPIAEQMNRTHRSGKISGKRARERERATEREEVTIQLEEDQSGSSKWSLRPGYPTRHSNGMSTPRQLQEYLATQGQDKLDDLDCSPWSGSPLREICQIGRICDRLGMPNNSRAKRLHKGSPSTNKHEQALFHPGPSQITLGSCQFCARCPDVFCTKCREPFAMFLLAAMLPKPVRSFVDNMPRDNGNKVEEVRAARTGLVQT